MNIDLKEVLNVHFSFDVSLYDVEIRGLNVLQISITESVKVLHTLKPNES